MFLFAINKPNVSRLLDSDDGPVHLGGDGLLGHPTYDMEIDFVRTGDTACCGGARKPRLLDWPTDIPTVEAVQKRVGSVVGAEFLDVSRCSKLSCTLTNPLASGDGQPTSLRRMVVLSTRYEGLDDNAMSLVYQPSFVLSPRAWKMGVLLQSRPRTMPLEFG